MTIKKTGSRGRPYGGEVLLEFHRIGNIMRVTAIDPRTGTEVITVADPRQSQDTIKAIATRKLAYVLKKKSQLNKKKNDDKF